MVVALVAGELLASDDTAPDAAVQPLDLVRRFPGQQYLALRDDRHPAAQVADVLDDVGREDHHDVLADLRQQVVEAEPLGRVEARGRLVDDDQLRIAEQRLRDAETLSAVARKSVILDGTSTTTCRGCMSEHRRQEPVWTSVRGAGVKAVSPAERGRERSDAP